MKKRIPRKAPPDAVRSRYEASLSVSEKLKQEAVYILKDALRKAKIKVHDIPARVKTVDSFLDKVRRMQCSDPMTQVTDIVGLRVICLFLSDLPRVGKVIGNAFHVLSVDDKIGSADAMTFGYMSIHYLVELPEDCRGARYDDIKNRVLEIQVRTLTMDAWATVSHYLAYKDASSVPTHLQKDFNALSGLFYVADSHFEMFFKQSEKSSDSAAAAFGKPKPVLDVRVDRDSLAAYMRKRLADREHADLGDVAELATELLATGYDTLSKLDEAIERGWSRFAEDESADPPSDSNTGEHVRYLDIGVIRNLLSLTDVKFKAWWKANKLSGVPPTSWTLG